MGIAYVPHRVRLKNVESPLHFQTLKIYSHFISGNYFTEYFSCDSHIYMWYLTGFLQNKKIKIF